MPSDFDMIPVSSAADDYLPPDAIHLSDIDEDGAAMGQLINQRRAQSENAEALRLARAL